MILYSVYVHNNQIYFFYTETDEILPENLQKWKEEISAVLFHELRGNPRTISYESPYLIVFIEVY